MKFKYFDFRDIFRTPRLALSGKKIWVHLFGIISGWLIYTVLTYIALLANGQSFSGIWEAYHFFPCLCCSTLPIAWYSWVIYGIGILLWIFIFMFMSLAVSRITYKQLKGDEFFSSGDSIKYAKKHGTAVIMGPVSLLLIMAFFTVMAIIAALISKVPVLDIIFLGLPYLLYFIVSVFVVYTGIVFLVSCILSPAIVGTAEEDTMETVFQSYSTVWAQPWRFVIYEAIVAGLSIVSTFLYGWALILGYKFFNLIFGMQWLMAGKMSRIVESASSYLFGNHSPLTAAISRFFNICTNSSLGMTKPLCLTTTDVITAVLVGIAMFILAGTVVSYFLTNFSVGQSLIYVILRKKKDDENLIERKDEDELEEEDNEDAADELEQEESSLEEPGEKSEKDQTNVEQKK